MHIVSTHRFTQDYDDGNTLHIPGMLDGADIDQTSFRTILGEFLGILDAVGCTQVDAFDWSHVEVALNRMLCWMYEEERNRQRHYEDSEEQHTDSR